MNRNIRPVRHVLFGALFIAELLILEGCSLPRIIILNDPLSAEEHVKLGRIYESQGNADLAAQQYEAAVKMDPKCVSSLLLLGDLSFRSGNYEAAESAYQKAIALQPENGDIYNNLCWVYLKQNHGIDKAGDLIKKALIATPGHRGYYLDTWGMVLLKLNRVAESVTVLRQAVALIPADESVYLAEAYAHLAEAYRKSGDEVQAGEAEKAAKTHRSQ
jgi:tetratricopeptide (TPR) repeat protein